MREIKFRGKRKDNGGWVYGYYFHGSSNDTHWIHLLDENTAVGPCVQVIPETVGQYTGLRDKNGKEIYEGDIYDNPCAIGLLQVVFDEGRFVGRHITHDEAISRKDVFGRIYPRCPNEQVEVIGDIHNNPELLEEKP